MSSLIGKEVQIVAALSSADLPEALIGDSCVKELISAVMGSQQKAKSANDSLDKARREKNEQNMFSNWWNNTEDKVKDAQLNLTSSIANLNRHSSQLLIFNTAISKVLCDQQNILLRQQQLLEDQASELNLQNLQILAQQKSIEAQQIEIRSANQGLLEAKGVTAEQARELVGCVQRVESAEQRITQVNQHLLTAIEQYLDQLRQELGDTLASSVTTLENRDKQLLETTQEHKDKLAEQTVALNKLQGKLSYFDDNFTDRLQNAIEQHKVPILQKVDSLDRQLEKQAHKHGRWIKGLILGCCLLCVGLAGVCVTILR